MNKWMAIAVALVAAAASVSADIADAKRMGGGRSLGAQRQATPAPTAPTSPSVAPSSPSAPVQAAPAKPAATPAAAGASRWLGPIAGLAAGLGLAALLSHFGLSEGFASFLLLALLVVGGVFLVRMLMSRRAQPARPLQYAGANAGASPRVEPRLDPTPAAPARFEPVMGATGAGPAPATATGRFPPGFDAAAFAEQAKLQFRKLQAAYDASDRKALAEVMTPEMFKEISGELAQRGTHLPTEVMRLDASVVDVATEGDSHWMSVHFTGLLREDGTVLPKEFDEVWNLTKPVDGSSGWLLAGIQQHAAA
jgi:predicted lipid-binding transport protein (Tim44 family)